MFLDLPRLSAQRGPIGPIGFPGSQGPQGWPGKRGEAVSQTSLKDCVAHAKIGSKNLQFATKKVKN